MNYQIDMDSARPQPFPPHGKVTVEVYGAKNDLMYLKCNGAFNRETMIALADIQHSSQGMLSPDRYVMIEFLETCMALPEFFFGSHPTS